jgi:hypothetical protein
MIEKFIGNNWRTLLLVVLILLGFFVWPTLYKELPPYGRIPQRQNRLTQVVERWMDEKWRVRDY